MKVIVILSLFFALTQWSLAVEDTAVLPKGVRSLMWKQGYVDSLTERYGNDSILYSLDGRLTKNFDATQILAIHSRAPELINGLNDRLLKGYNLGEKIQLGQLQFSGDANLQYMAPVFAYGMSEKWTLAVAVPFAKLQANIHVNHSGFNNAKKQYDALSAQGGLLPEADQAFKTLMNLDLKQEFYNYLENKEYKPLDSDSAWHLGDVQLISKYKYYDSPKWTLLNKVTINLPTGTADDPNDFVDLPIFHRRFVEVSQVQDYHVSNKLVFGSALTYIWNMPDHITKRVPTSETDYLPDANRLENVERDIGDALRWELNTRYALNSNVSLVGAYVGSYKVEDFFDGNRNYNYSLLARDTEIAYHRYELQASYTTVDDYLNKKASIPYSIAYRFSDLFAGQNIERQKTHELTLMVFF